MTFPLHLLKRLNTQRLLFQSKPSSYRKNVLQEIEQSMLKLSATDRLDCENKLMNSQNADLINKF